jgi:HAD superfamily hydrolase (TIGR01450 family)
MTITHGQAGTKHTPPDDLHTLAEGYIFDLDGTIYLGNDLLPGALHTVRTLRAQGRRVLFLSNNPTREIDAYVRKLNGLGLDVTPAEILTTVETIVRWVRQHHPAATVFPIAEEPVHRALAEAGIRISDDPEQIDIVIASYDRGFVYRKLQIAFDAIAVHKRAFLIATNPDRFCPFPGGRGEPDAAAIIGAVEGCTGVRCQQVVGKPDPYMLEAALQRLNLPASRCVMVGDRLSTDIRMAVDAGMPSALVLTGETTPELLAASDIRPSRVLARIDELLPPALREPEDEEN